jgi:hypothetical protein
MSEYCELCGRPMLVGQKNTHYVCKSLRDQGIAVEYRPISWPVRRSSGDKPWLSDEYLTYLTTPKWKAFRRKALEAANYLCQRPHCGIGSKLHVHHVTYDRLGNELLADVLVLCETHHRLEHQRIDAVRLDDARFRGWALKVFGDEYDDEYAYQEYEAWLERHEGAA